MLVTDETPSALSIAAACVSGAAGAMPTSSWACAGGVASHAHEDVDMAPRHNIYM